jgi:DNA-binding transcriptional LysR family regulator
MKDFHRRRRIDLNLLVVLEAIYSAGGVSRAGERLSLTQSAISHALSRLRQVFADPLFVRHGHGLVPTPLTRGLIGPLRQSLHDLGVLVDAVTEDFDPQRMVARFTIGLRDPLEVLVLAHLMSQIAESAPNVDLRTAHVRRRALETALATGTIDLAIDVLLPLSDSVRRQKIAANRLVVVARKGHPTIRPGFKLATYMRQEHVMVTSRDRGPSLEDLQLTQRGLERRIRLRCRNYLAAFSVVRESDLILTMPQHYDILNATFGNQILPLPLRTPTLDVYLYWHRAVDDNAANRWLRDIVKKSFSVTEGDRRGRNVRRPSSQQRRRPKTIA